MKPTPATLAIDLGTSSVKTAVVNRRGEPLSIASADYPISSPSVGIALQHPATWWRSAAKATRDALTQASVEIEAIGLTGQMHGTVLLGEDLAPIQPAIIWPDQRAAAQVTEIVAQFGMARFTAIAGTAPAAGFMGSTLLWLKQNEPDILNKTRHCFLPKDYLRLRLTGSTGTDWTDASGTALFDVRERVWSQEIIEGLGLPFSIFPQVNNPIDVVGHLTQEAAKTLGLPSGIPVVAGCADQVGQAVANNLFEAGRAAITIGSGGQIFAPLADYFTDPQGRLHTFCHSTTRGWYMLGAMLNAGLSLRWLRDLLSMSADPAAFAQLSAEAAAIAVGSEGLYFLPYLSGERSPIMDPTASGSLNGLRLRHSRGHVARAVMEGVSFGILHIIETMREVNGSVDQLLASGNGLSSPVWRQILADVLGVPLHRPQARERTATGAALLAMIGAKILPGYPVIMGWLPPIEDVTEPNMENHARYREIYPQWRAFYPALRAAWEPKA